MNCIVRTYGEIAHAHSHTLHTAYTAHMAHKILKFGPKDVGCM